MTNDPAYLLALKELSRLRTIPRAEMARHAREIVGTRSRSSNGRGTALICGSLLEHNLEAAIRDKLVDLTNTEYKALFRGEAPLRTFSAKIKIGYALGLYGPVGRKQIELIKDIRNAFAHTLVPMNFTTKQVRDACMHLVPLQRMAKKMQSHGKWRFVLTSLNYAQALTMISPDGTPQQIP